MLRTATLLAVLAAVLALAAPRPDAAGAAVPPAAAAVPAPGPGAVLSLHVGLLAALDRGDAEPVTAALAPDEEVGGVRRRALVFLAGAPAARGEGDARELLARWPALWCEGRGKVETRIVEHQTECASGDLSYGVFELSRTYERDVARLVDRLRMTSLVAYRDGRWRLFHLHVSPVALAEPALAEAKKER